ncbi:L,D-transpeptidase [Enterovirga sp.]|jgi:lipoprotein-anchoring transpeptidase ErfK/SrfK|uniref:L,D-transpeptidase n=1 Tax=Enterovirga sp. TaxID=2026350 RepID=UPI00261BBDB2|nr:L,D-transpeptidase [Enterovirga sp.]MDB5591553.1 hypothetical protein [Enterovirga sp.]
MSRTISALLFGAALAASTVAATPAAAYNPIAEFFGLFSTQAIPRQLVSWPGREAPGTVVVSTSQRRLYYVLGGGQAIRYGVGVGREGFTWSGTKLITAKREWPGWTPPPAMRRRIPSLPHHIPGGPDNPLGARALYLGSSLYRIHGSNEDHTIGAASSSGCIRMTNADVMDLYQRVRVGTRVIVVR